MEKKTIYDDTYPLDDRFPVHMNRLWMKKYHGTDEHWHWHDFYEISYICSGTATCFVDGNDYLVHQGDIVVFNAGEIHGWNMQEDVELLVLTFSKDMIVNDPYIDEEILPFFQEWSEGYANIISRRAENTKLICNALFSAWQEWNNRQIGKNTMIKAELLLILACLSRYFSGSREDLETVQKNRRDLMRINQGLLYLDAHYDENISIRDVASEAGMSPSYFSKLFHRLMGLTFTQYLVQKRIYQANEMLETTDKNVIDIAAECGFNSTANFYRTYRKYYQKAPRQKVSADGLYDPTAGRG